MRPPSVDRVARSLADTGLPHPLLVDAARAAIAAGDPDRAHDLAEAARRSLLGPVINGTGTLLHTNLGRAPFAVAVDARYSNVEFDLDTGRRGSRHGHAARLLARTVDAEAALIVNNGAAAVTLALAALAPGGPVAVSRGELVEIGGGFRIPEVIEASGARLMEVGTTNRTRLGDFTAAVADGAALLLRVHQSNYRITGFTEQVPLDDMSGLGVPLVVDLGSGLLDTACHWLPDGPPPWLAGEPAVRQTLADGADLVTFSGDKLLGGPQAGILVGRAEFITRCAQHPLARALRPGGHVLAALQDLALTYLNRRGTDIPFWRLATTPVEGLQRRASALVPTSPGTPNVHAVTDGPTHSVPGGGTLPGVTLPSWGIHLRGDRTAELRNRRMPVIARVEDGTTTVDLRTVFPDEDAELGRALAEVTDRP